MHGIDGDNSASEAEFGEQCLHRRDFIRLLVTVEMRQHQGGVGGKRAQDVSGLAVLEMVEAVTQCLAVEGNVAFARGAGLRVQDGGMAPKDLFDRSRIQLLENEPDGGVGRRAPPWQRERVLQPSEMDINEAVNCPVGVGPGEHRQNSEQQHVRQTIKLAFCASRVFDLGKQSEKWGQ